MSSLNYFLPQESPTEVFIPTLAAGRYVARQVGSRWFVYDTLRDCPSSSHDTERSADTRAYILNRFSTGARI